MFITNEAYNVHFQSIREEYVRISLLQQYFVSENNILVRKYKKIGEIQGNVIGGNISINVNSDIRRTCSLDIGITNSSFFIGRDKKIWLDKLFKVEIGIRNLINDNVVWFNKGVYAIDNPKLDYSLTGKSLHIEGLDLMCTLNGTLGGQLGYITEIPFSTPLKDALLTSINKLGGISLSNQYIENNDYTLPYSIKKDADNNVYDLLKEIKELYMDYEMFFDENGTFIYRKIKNRIYSNGNFANDIISYNFIAEKDVSCSCTINYNFENVKNKVIVWGKLKKDGSQAKYIVENTDINSPFNVNSNIGTILLSITDDKIYEIEQAKTRAEHELWLHNDMNESIDISCLPLYFLNGNEIIEIHNDEIGIDDKYLVDEINIQLGDSKTMGIVAHKIRTIQ